MTEKSIFDRGCMRTFFAPQTFDRDTKSRAKKTPPRQYFLGLT
jgi:hypothetical protein